MTLYKWIKKNTIVSLFIFMFIGSVLTAYDKILGLLLSAFCLAIVLLYYFKSTEAQG